MRQPPGLNKTSLFYRSGWPHQPRPNFPRTQRRRHTIQSPSPSPSPTNTAIVNPLHGSKGMKQTVALEALILSHSRHLEPPSSSLRNAAGPSPERFEHEPTTSDSRTQTALVLVTFVVAWHSDGMVSSLLTTVAGRGPDLELTCIPRIPITVSSCFPSLRSLNHV